MMNRTQPQAVRLVDGGYMPPHTRPQCSNCSQHQPGVRHQTGYCAQLDAPVAGQGLCPAHVPGQASAIKPLNADRSAGLRTDKHTNVALQLAAGEDGLTSLAFAQATGSTPKYSATRIKRIAKRGALWPAKALPAPTHWFLTEERAAAWMATEGKRRSTKAAKERRTSTPSKPRAKGEPRPGHTLLAKPKPGVEPAVKGNTTGHKPVGEATNPNNVQPQYGRHYTHDVRIQCAPDEQPFGAGFAAAGLGISPITGKGWEPRA